MENETLVEVESRSIQYSLAYLKLLLDLTKISNKVLIEKDEENGVICTVQKNPEKYMAYVLTAPYHYFDIADNVGIHDFKAFSSFFKRLNNPTIEQVDNKLVLVSGNKKINYVLSNPEFCWGAVRNIDFDRPAYEFEFTKKMIVDIIDSKKHIESRYASFSCNCNGVVVRLGDTPDTYCEYSFDAKIFDGATEVEFKIRADVFEKIPKRDYILTIQCPGNLRFSSIDKEVGLDIYTGRVKEREE